VAAVVAAAVVAAVVVAAVCFLKVLNSIYTHILPIKVHKLLF